MSDTKHMPGPWRDVKHSCDADTGSWTIEIHGPSGFAFDLVRVCEDEEDHREFVANARLIAAAPELLQEVEMALEREYNSFEPDNQSARYSRLKALVAKAKGLRFAAAQFSEPAPTRSTRCATPPFSMAQSECIRMEGKCARNHPRAGANTRVGSK